MSALERAVEKHMATLAKETPTADNWIDRVSRGNKIAMTQTARTKIVGGGFLVSGGWRAMYQIHSPCVGGDHVGCTVTRRWHRPATDVEHARTLVHEVRRHLTAYPTRDHACAVLDAWQARGES